MKWSIPQLRCASGDYRSIATPRVIAQAALFQSQMIIFGAVL
jgi:hypothetical protein